MAKSKGKGGKLSKGDRFTIEGVGIGSKGQLVVDGVNVKTRRKCKPVRPAVMTVSSDGKC